MEKRRSVDTRHGIADTLTSGASLLVRYLAYGISLTSRTVLATLAEDGRTRLTALAAGTGVSQPPMTQCVGRMGGKAWSFGSSTPKTCARHWSMSPSLSPRVRGGCRVLPRYAAGEPFADPQPPLVMPNNCVLASRPLQ